MFSSMKKLIFGGGDGDEDETGDSNASQPRSPPDRETVRSARLRTAT